MKQYVRQFLLFVIALLLTGGTAIAADTPVTLIQNKKTSWQITPASGNKQVQFAAAELQKYLARIGGVTIPVSTKEKKELNIIIGLKSDIKPEYAGLLPAATKGYNGYSVAVSANPAVVVIAGDDGPGVIYAAYDVLEKVGCRWFYPQQDANDVEVVPQLSTVSLNADTWAAASQTQYRI